MQFSLVEYCGFTHAILEEDMFWIKVILVGMLFRIRLKIATLLVNIFNQSSR